MSEERPRYILSEVIYELEVLTESLKGIIKKLELYKSKIEDVMRG